MSWHQKTRFVANHTQKTSFEKESGAMTWYSMETALPLVGLIKFSLLCKEKKVTVYSPKNDLCDKRLAYKNKEMSPDDFHSHLLDKSLARVILIIFYLSNI